MYARVFRCAEAHSINLHWKQLPILPALADRDLVCTVRKGSKVQNDVERCDLISKIRIALRRRAHRRARVAYPCGAAEQAHHIGMHPVGNFGNAVEPHGISRDVHDGVGGVRHRQDEPDHRTAVSGFWPVPRGRRRDSHSRTVSGVNIMRVPRGQPEAAFAKAPRASHRRHDDRCIAEQPAACSIEVVEMMIVTEQDYDDRRKFLSCDRWALRLPQDVRRVAYSPGAASNVGSVSSRTPPSSRRVVGPPTYVN
jgi:hypothetical protein